MPCFVHVNCLSEAISHDVLYSKDVRHRLRVSVAGQAMSLALVWCYNWTLLRSY
jgi:hypothetical protein